MDKIRISDITMKQLARQADHSLSFKGKIEISDDAVAAARERVNKLLGAHVLYPELDLDFLKKEFVK